MKLSFDRKTFTDTVHRVGRFSPSRSTKPILSYIHLTSSDEDAVFTATNLEMSLETTLRPNSVAQSGECLLHGARILAIAQSATDYEITLESNDSGVLVRSGRGRWQLASEDPYEFPRVTKMTEGATATLGAKLFMDAARLASIATDASATRYALAGVMIESVGDGAIRLVGTDGRRLVAMTLPVACREFSGIVDRACLTQLTAGMIEAGDVKISMDVAWFRAETTGCVGTARLLEGRFPKYQDILTPFTFTAENMLSSGALAAAVQQVAVTTAQGEAAIDMTLGGGLLKLASKAAGVGDSDTELPVRFAGDEIGFACNPAMLRDFLRAAGDHEMQFAFGGINKGQASSISLSFEGCQFILMGLQRDR